MEDWKNDRAEASMREEEAKNMAKSAAKLKLKEKDPKDIAYYKKEFPNLTSEEQEEMRVDWINNNPDN